MISPAFARVLAAGRKPFNARVEEAKRRASGFDPAVFFAFLQEHVDGLVAAVDVVAPARTMGVALAAYDIALTLCAQGLAAAVGPLWSRVLPALAARVVEQPQDVLGSLSNAVVHLAGVDGARVDDWLGSMASLGPGAEDVAQLLGLGQVLAWRAGMAHWRAGALAALDALPPALQRAALGAADEAGWPALRARFDADPWAGAQPGAHDGWQVGGFTGFGGRFAQPPELRVGADGFVLRSGARHFLAIADAFGAVLLPATAEEFAAAAAPRAPDGVHVRDGRVAVAGREIALDLPPDGLALAANAHTLALASPWTHALRLLPLR